MQINDCINFRKIDSENERCYRSSHHVNPRLSLSSFVSSWGFLQLKELSSRPKACRGRIGHPKCQTSRRRDARIAEVKPRCTGAAKALCLGKKIVTWEVKSQKQMQRAGMRGTFLAERTYTPQKQPIILGPFIGNMEFYRKLIPLATKWHHVRQV